MKQIIIFLTAIGFSVHLMAQNDNPVVMEFSKKDLESTPANLSAVADKITFVKLETVPEALIGNAGSYYCIKFPGGFIIYPGQGRDMKNRWMGN